MAAKFPEPDFGSECVLILENGMQLRGDGEDPDGTSYVRVCDVDGDEIAYWTADEWCDEPESVMGAVLGALVHSQLATEVRYGPDA